MKREHTGTRTQLLFLLFVALACGGQGPGDPEPPMTPDAVTFLALGDSYTIGESVSPGLRWPVQLASALDRQGVLIDDPVIVARTGWTTDELAREIMERDLGGRYDIVSLLIGVNNQYRGRDVEEYRTEFVDLLGQAINFAGGVPGRVLVLSIPDWGVTPFAEGRDRSRIAAEIDAFNEVNRGESQRLAVRYLDVTGISREAATNPDLVAEDGLHPSGAMYARWAGAALPIVLEMLTLR
jgi:lysophospholipase L1-like esterase